MKPESIKAYTVHRLTSSCSGHTRHVPWHLAQTQTDFTFPWEDGDAPPLEFQAVYDEEWFYCAFQVVDDMVSIYSSTNEKIEVLYGDRVEIFLSPDRSLATYYALEIDYLARVYDYRASFYRKFDARWSWPKDDIAIEAEKTATGYHVFLALSLKSLRALGLLHDSEMLTGLFRGKCAAASPSMNSMRWISWLKPDSPTPDFHIPSAFGTLRFA